jgi:hypothetical protein
MYNLHRCNEAIYENHRIFTLVTLIDSFEDFLFYQSFLIFGPTGSGSLVRFYSLLKIPDFLSCQQVSNSWAKFPLLVDNSLICIFSVIYFFQLENTNCVGLQTEIWLVPGFWDFAGSKISRFCSFRDSTYFKIRRIHALWDSEIFFFLRFRDFSPSEIPRFSPSEVPRFLFFRDSEIFLLLRFWDFQAQLEVRGFTMFMKRNLPVFSEKTFHFFLRFLASFEGADWCEISKIPRFRDFTRGLRDSELDSETSLKVCEIPRVCSLQDS